MVVARGWGKEEMWSCSWVHMQDEQVLEIVYTALLINLTFKNS